MLKIGKLYICEDYFLLLYPDQEASAAAAAYAAAAATTTAAAAEAAVAAAALTRTLNRAPGSPGAAEAAAAIHATYWTRKLGKSVSYTDKNIPLLSLNNKEKYVEVLVEEKVGWIIVEDWLGIKEIVV